jgi:hypothetical protein
MLASGEGSIYVARAEGFSPRPARPPRYATAVSQRAVAKSLVHVVPSRTVTVDPGATHDANLRRR